MVQNSEYELALLVHNRQTEQLAILTLTAFDKLERTQMAREKKTLSDRERACGVSEFLATLYLWGSNGTVVFILGEYCGGGPLTRHIKPRIGIESDQYFWRLAFQLAQGIADIHALGLHRMGIQARSILSDCRFFHRHLPHTSCSLFCAIATNRPMTRYSKMTAMCVMATSVCTISTRTLA